MHRARHTVPGRLSPPPPAAGFGDGARHSHTAAKDRRSRWAHREAEVEASGTTLTEIFGLGPILAAKIIGALGNVVRLPNTRPTSPPTPVRRRWRPRVARWYATGSRWPETASSIMLCTCSPPAKLGRTFGAEPTSARR